MDIYPIFWNEYLIYLNSFNRQGVNPEKSKKFAIKSANNTKIKELFYILRYYMAACLNVVLLIIKRKNEYNNLKSIFVFCGLRDKWLFRRESTPLRVGLYNLRYHRYPHVLSSLSICEWLWAMYLSYNTYPSFYENARLWCVKQGESWKAFQNMTLFGRLRYFDAILHLIAFEKYGREVWFVEHFDMYVMVLSLLREKGAISNLIGCQHGFFEYPPKSRSYLPLFTDAYWLKHAQSRTWVVNNLLKNKNCKIYVDEKRAQMVFKILERESNVKVVAYAAQEFLDWDFQIIDKLLLMKKKSGMKLSVLLYLHPSFPGVMKAEWIKAGLRVEKDRHKNIDLLITRFSTIGFEYHRIGVPVIFVPFDDRVCVFESGDFTLCADLDQMEFKAMKILSLQTDSQ